MRKYVLWGIFVVLIAVTGCQKAEPVPSDVGDASGAPVLAGDRDWAERSLDVVSRLSLGTLELEGTGNAITAEQAATLLPLWTLIQNGTLQSVAETEAVVRQIESQMTEAQLAAIDALELTLEDLRTWMAEQGIEVATAQGPGTLLNLSDEERAAMREKFQNMTPEERATAMAELGIQRPEGAGTGGGFGGQRGAGGGTRANAMLAPLIEMLTERAGQ